jgi:hypothetical protein
MRELNLPPADVVIFFGETEEAMMEHAMLIRLEPNSWDHETWLKPERKWVGCGATEGFTSPLNLCATCEEKVARGG